MKLADYQRMVVEASLSRDPSPALFEQLGQAPRFRLYRHMIRARIHGMAQVAFKHAAGALGAERFAACCDRYLAERPPASPFIREVVAELGPFAREDLEIMEGAPPYLSDLLRFEESKWRLSYAACQRPRVGEDGVRELSFEGVPVWNPLLVALSLSYPVHTWQEQSTLPHASCSLLMYRPEGSDEVRWYAPDALLAGLVQSALQQPQPLSQLVRAVAHEQQRELDQVLLESLADGLTLALQRGVLVGVR